MALPVVPQLMAFINNNIMLVGIAAGVIALAVYVYNQRFSGRKTRQGLIEEEEIEGKPLDKKTKPEFLAEMKHNGQNGGRVPLYYNSQMMGEIEKYMTKEIPADRILSYKDGREYKLRTGEEDEEGEEEIDETVEMYFFLLKPGGKLNQLSDWLAKQLGGETQEHIRIVRTDFVDENALGMHVERQAEFKRYGGVLIENSVPGINAVNEVPLTKTLERHVNDKDEYARKTDRMDRKHSKRIDVLDRESELEERRFGNRLDKR